MATTNRFTAEQIAAIRASRAEIDAEGKPVHTHASLAKEYNTSAGRISQIVRNITYTDRDYKPTNDGDGTPPLPAEPAAAE